MVDGLDKFNARVAAIPERIRENVQKAMEAAADQIVADMKRLAPKDTGELAASIGWTWGEAPAGSMVVGTVGRGTKRRAAAGGQYASMQITIYAGGGKAFHARFQEFGTAKMPANPFFFPVWRARRRGVKSAISGAIRKALRESAS